MKQNLSLYTASAFFALLVVAAYPGFIGNAEAAGSVDAGQAPAPLVTKGRPVQWWFVFKFNAHVFPGCGDSTARACAFGGELRRYVFGQQYVYASSDTDTLAKGSGCVGATTIDPVGATFDEVYNHSFYYVIWNDQFYNDPEIAGCTRQCGSPWGHSKGMLVWNRDGDGFVMQVSTPSWPAAGSKVWPRQRDGNTLGCIRDDDVKVSQHFFALRLTKADLVKVLLALKNASVVTDPENRQIVNNGGPADVQGLVRSLGTRSHNATILEETLSSGVDLISKPSALHVPPWQMVSAELDGVPLRTATWWARPRIPSTTASTRIACWDNKLGKPGPVEIATSGQWDEKTFGLKGGPGPNFNHAKIGVSTSGRRHYAIFGDLNQQGTLSGKNCGSSQNGRGGLFYVISDKALAESVAGLIKGSSAPRGNAQ
ncbi:MAG: deoxyribonuclease II family protein [Acidiferrobacterales bacterium]